jgi:hypothetical protein
MGSFKNPSKTGMVFVLAVFFAFSLLWVACSEKQPGVTGPQPVAVTASSNLSKAAAVQSRYTDGLMKLNGVEGVGLGLGLDGQLAIKVFTSKPTIAGLSKELDGLPVETELTGKFVAFARPLSGRYRPAPIGVSISNNLECATGTLGCVVEKAGKKYILSNNHVLARENLASIGEDIVQPGRYDNKPKCANRVADNKIADLSEFVVLGFDGTDTNLVDAAIAELSTSDFTCATLPQFYGLPSSTPVDATLGLPVKKVGRTSVLTTGTITAVNATIRVGYSGGVALFVGQIVTSRHFIKSGDSGSLMVTNDANSNPVGLLFAGTSDGVAIANSIEEVLQAFNVSICGN